MSVEVVSNKFPPVAVSYHCILSPVAVKSAIVEAEQKVCSESPVGASGAVAGIIYGAILLNPDMRLMMFPLPIPIPGYVFGLGYLLYSIYGMKKQLGNVGHSAHLGGAIGGYALMLVLYPEIFTRSFTTVALLGVPIVLLLLFGHKLKK